MWIAKPLAALSAEEQAAWCGIIKQRALNSEDAPLAQALAWGRAIQSVSGKTYVVFSLEEKAGGIVFESAQGLECVNGPLMDWDDAEKAPRQLAVFATAASRLPHRFNSLTLRPRWQEGQCGLRLSRLPLAAHRTTSAATIKIALRGRPPGANSTGFTPRLQRTLRRSDRAGLLATHEALTSSSLIEFVVAAQAFGKKRGFTVPPLLWFRSLTEPGQLGESLSFHLVTAHTPDGDSGTQLLIAWHEDEAHYLFGHEWRSEHLSQAISPSAVAHRLAIRTATEAGLRFYDFNGTIENPPANHAYAGVAAFKAQFGGSVVRYEVPEFRIET